MQVAGLYAAIYMLLCFSLLVCISGRQLVATQAAPWPMLQAGLLTGSEALGNWFLRNEDCEIALQIYQRAGCRGGAMQVRACTAQWPDLVSRTDLLMHNVRPEVCFYSMHDVGIPAHIAVAGR